jgi:hypothetical protein
MDPIEPIEPHPRWIPPLAPPRARRSERERRERDRDQHETPRPRREPPTAKPRSGDDRNGEGGHIDVRA